MPDESTWIVAEDQLPESGPDFLSSIFTIGNGRSSTRGTLPEEGLEAFRGVYLSGVYTKAGWGLNYYMGGPDWLCARLEQGGRPLQCRSSRRELNLAEGVLRRVASFAAASNPDAHVEVEELRLASWANPNLMGQRVTIRNTGGLVDLSLVIGIDANVRNHFAKYYKAGELPNCDAHGVKVSGIERLEADAERLCAVLLARATGTRTQVLARVRASGADTGGETVCDGGRGLAAIRYAIPEGTTEPFVFEKTCVVTGDTPGYEEAVKDGEAAFGRIARDSFDTSLVRHKEAVARFWDVADVRIEGDDAAQLAVRFAVWSARIAAPSDNGASSIGAKNLTGDWYRGAVFWDMDIFGMPVLAAVDPQRARNHLLYRRRCMEAAAKTAAQDGFRGVRYPWQSYQTGFEEPPVMGGFLYQQQHVNVAVAVACLRDYHLTGDKAFLFETTMPVITEVCRFWESRVDGPDADGHYHIHGVTGPDEDHQCVNDNAYTNVCVAWLLKETAALGRSLGLLEEAECSRWERIAPALHVPRLPGGRLLSQFEGFAGIPEPDETRRGPMGLREDKPSKQADTLLLWQTIPEAVAGEALAAHFDEYAPLCTHGSSLSPGTHAILAARLGRARDAERLYAGVIGMDLADRHGNTAHGIHGAGQAGVWLATVNGFGGLMVTRDGLRINPRLPSKWKRLAYSVPYRGQLLNVEVTGETLTVRNTGDEAVELALAGQAAAVGPGSVVAVPHVSTWTETDLQGVIFDLDGVLVTTDHFHFQAWKELADELGIPFDEEANHRLRGVSRQESLRRIFGDRPLPPEAEFAALCARKNARYVELISSMTADDVLPGSVELLTSLREAGIRVGIASASRNTPLVLERTGLDSYMDAVADGNIVTESKPSPQVFFLAAQRMRVLPWNCIGIEDAESGVESIHRAGMVAVGIGSQTEAAEYRVENTAQLSLEVLRDVFNRFENPVDPYLERNLGRAKEDETTSYAVTLASGRK